MPETALSRGRALPVVHIPSQTSVGFEVVVPTNEDAKDLGRFVEHSRLGKGRLRIQPVYALKAAELKWAPAGPLPPLREFAAVVATWARRKGYALARDMRELRQGLDMMRGGKTASAERLFVRLASSGEPVETVVEEAYFHTGDGGLNISLVETASFRPGNDVVPPSTYFNYRCDYHLSNMGARASGSFDLGDAPHVQWLIEALTRILPRVQQNRTGWSPFDAPNVSRMDGVRVEKEETEMASDSSARVVAARFKTAAGPDLATTLNDGVKLLSDLETWTKKFPQVLRGASTEGLPLGWVWQDDVAAFFTEYDTKFFRRHQELEFALSDLSFTLDKAGKAATAALFAFKEPTGKGAMMYALNKLKFFPHPQKREHIAYPTDDLKVWHQAYLTWLANAERVLKEQVRRAKK